MIHWEKDDIKYLDDTILLDELEYFKDEMK